MDESDLNFGEEYDDEDFCRGYGLSSVEGLEDPYFEARQAQEEQFAQAEENDTAPEMPQNFYVAVENFLTKPPPSISDTVGKAPKKQKNKSGAALPGVTLPDIHAKSIGGNMVLPQPPQAVSKVRSKLMSNANKPVARNFDHNLLREAFAYTDMLLKEALIDEANSAAIGAAAGNDDGYAVVPRGKAKKGSGALAHKPPSHAVPMESIYMAPHPSSAPVGGKAKGEVPLSRPQASGSKGAVKKLRAKVPSESQLDNDTFNVNIDAGDVGRRNPVNYDELIANFEGGLMLQKLRKELEDSKQSMKQSENVMRKLSMDFFSAATKGKGRANK
jgi:hypothetical protein